MNISPLDIRKHEFKRSLRGFDPDEVLAFLDMVSLEFETLVRENAMMSEKIAHLNDQLKTYRDIESTLQETLMSAQRAREDTITIAKKQADVIVREAEVKAASIIEEGCNELSRLRSMFSELKIHKDTYFAKLNTIVKSQLEMLGKYSFPEEEKFNNIESVSGKEETLPAPEENMETKAGKPANVQINFGNPLEDNNKNNSL